METTHTFIVPEEEAAKRLDIFLTGKLPEMTRSGIKNLLVDGMVRVNDKPTKAGYKIKHNDRIRVTVPEAPGITLEPEEIPLDVLYEDGDVLVINKGAGIAVHPGAGRGKGTLVNAIISHTRELSKIGGELRPGVVHRLDKDTTGVLVIAKNDFSHLRLAKQFSEHSTERKYLALVWGTFKEDEGVIDIPIGRDIAHRKKISGRTRKSRTAITLYRVLKRYPQLTLLELTPKTGRTHQLRVHLSAINHPVVGDQVYGRKKIASGLPKPLDEALKKIKRQLLHAVKLGFMHPRREAYMEFTAPPPGDMDDLLKLIEKQFS